MPDINSEWAKRIAKYPERYGALGGLFTLLLKEVEVLNALPLEKIQYFRDRFRAINSD